jgi:GTP-binding protein
MTHAPSGPTPFPPVRLLHERGVRLFTGSDGVRDAWSPLNNGDMLERAYLIAYRCGFRDDADIALLIIDATEGVTSQDQRLAERVDASGCPIVVMLNKWEMIDDAERRLEVHADVKRKLGFIGDAPIVKISALTGKGVHKLRPLLQDAITQYHRRVPTRDVNKVIAAAQQKQPAGHGIKVLYALQGATDPPTFTLFVNRELPGTYMRYLERSIREAFDFGNTPIKLRVRKRTD